MAAANLFLYLQEDINVQFSNQEYEDFMIYVVNSKPAVAEITNWLKIHTIQEQCPLDPRLTFVSLGI
jgi:hypothetical protein